MDDPRSRYQAPIDTESLAAAIAPATAAAVAAAMQPIIELLIKGQGEQAQTLIQNARSRRPESYNFDFEYHNKSHFRPDGEPLPELRCESFLGYWDDEEQKVIPAYPYLADEYGGCTREERDILNALEPGIYKVRRRDGIEGSVRVEIRKDVDGTPMRLVVCVPKNWLGKELKNMIGGVEMLRQLVPQKNLVTV